MAKKRGPILVRSQPRIIIKINIYDSTCQWQFNFDDGSLFQLTFIGDSAVMLFKDFMADHDAESCSLFF